MNRNAKNSFMKISGAISAYKAATVEILTRYRDADERAKRDAAQYKDEDQRYQEAKAALVAGARQELDAARARMGEIIKAEVDNLRGVLKDHVIIRPNPVFTDVLKSYTDFDLQPTETEIKAMLELSGGAALGLKMMNAALEKVHSDYRIEYTDVTAFERDIAYLAGLAERALCYAPEGCHHEICQLYADSPRLRNGIDLGEKWSSTSLITQKMIFESAVDGLDAMSERWSAETVPSIKQLEDFYKDNEDATAAEQFIADREAVADAATVTTTPDITKARQMGHDRAEANRAARDVVQMYADGRV